MHSTQFVEYILENALPVFEDIPNTVAEDTDVENGKDKASSTNVNQTELLKTLAELSVYCGVMDEPEFKLQCLHKCLLVSTVVQMHIYGLRLSMLLWKFKKLKSPGSYIDLR